MTAANPTYLVPVDGSPSSFRALAFAVDLAQNRAPKGRLKIITVLDLSRVDVFDGFYLTTEQLQRVKRDVQEGTLDRARSTVEAAAPDLEVETALGEGHTVDVILSHVKTHTAALVVGRSGKRGVERLMMGSIPARLVASASVPVIVVP